MCRVSSDKDGFGLLARPPRGGCEARNLSFRPSPVLGFHPF
jgi:hypothetical protein